MASDTETTPKHRPTLADQNARYYELLMAQATKSPRQGAQTATLTERTTGAANGDLAVKVELVQHPEESDVQFIGRMESFGRQALAVRDKLNAEQAPLGERGSGEAAKS